MNAFLLWNILFLTSSWTNYSIDRTPLDLEKSSFPSPDGNCVAKFEYGKDGWYHLAIEDLSTGRTDDSIKVELTPIFSVQWTGDSKSIVTVSHIAHGSIATLFHQNNQKHWSSELIFPGETPAAHPYRVICEIAKSKTGTHDVTLTYEVGIQTKSESEGFQEKDYLVTLLVDPTTHKTVELKRTSVDKS